MQLDDEFHRFSQKSRQQSVPERLIHYGKQSLKQKFPTLNLLVNSSANDYANKRLILYMIGTFYGLIIYALSINQIEDLSAELKTTLLASIVLITSTSLTFLPNVRCFISLVVFNLVSSAGKIAFTSLIITSILDGPVHNTVFNLKQFHASFQCQNELLKNISTLSKSSFKVKKQFLDDVKHAQRDLYTQKTQLSSLIHSLNDELNTQSKQQHKLESFLNSNFDYDFASVSKSESKRGTGQPDDLASFERDLKNRQLLYYEKNIERCLKILKEGELNCQLGLRVDYSSDQDLADECKVQNMAKFEGKNATQVCRQHFSNVSYEGFGETSFRLANLDEQFDKNFDLNVNFKYNLKQNRIVNRHKLIQLQVDLKNFNASLRQTSEIMRLFARATRIMSNYGFSFVFVNSFKYNFKYLRDVAFDNECLTEYFRHIDARRYLLSKRTVLPLKKFEQKMFKYPFQLFISAYQRPTIRLNLAIQSSLVVTFVISILIDYVLYDFLNIIKHLIVIEYSYKSYNSLNMTISGEGFVANMLKKLAGLVNKGDENNFESNVSTEKCTPTLAKTDTAYVVKLMGQFVLLAALILVEIYVKRFNKQICAFFYPKWEKKRIVWLYNHMLKKRSLFIRNAKKKILFKIRNDLIRPERGLLNILNSKKLIVYLNMIGIARNYCILCDHLLKKRQIECAKCTILYCVECWKDLEKRCPGCSIDYSDDYCWQYDADF